MNGVLFEVTFIEVSASCNQSKPCSHWGIIFYAEQIFYSNNFIWSIGYLSFLLFCVFKNE